METQYLESTRDYVFRNTFADIHRLSERSARRVPSPSTRSTTSDTSTTFTTSPTRGSSTSRSTCSSCSGCSGANAATTEQLVHMRHRDSLFGEDAFSWSAAGVGYPGEFHLVAGALMMGGHVRVGLEDNLRVTLDRRAASNAELVEAMTLASLLDREPATAAGRGSSSGSLRIPAVETMMASGRVCLGEPPRGRPEDHADHRLTDLSAPRPGAGARPPGRRGCRCRPAGRGDRTRARASRRRSAGRGPRRPQRAHRVEELALNQHGVAGAPGVGGSRGRRRGVDLIEDRGDHLGGDGGPRA